jgi:hypothetical protein
MTPSRVMKVLTISTLNYRAPSSRFRPTDTFPIVKRKDEATHGEYRTKSVILEIYDQMARAARSGESYYTPLDQPHAILNTGTVVHHRHQDQNTVTMKPSKPEPEEFAVVDSTAL